GFLNLNSSLLQNTSASIDMNGKVLRGIVTKAPDQFSSYLYLINCAVSTAFGRFEISNNCDVSPASTLQNRAVIATDNGTHTKTLGAAGLAQVYLEQGL